MRLGFFLLLGPRHRGQQSLWVQPAVPPCVPCLIVWHVRMHAWNIGAASQVDVLQRGTLEGDVQEMSPGARSDVDRGPVHKAPPTKATADGPSKSSTPKTRVCRPIWPAVAPKSELAAVPDNCCISCPKPVYPMERLVIDVRTRNGPTVLLVSSSC